MPYTARWSIPIPDKSFTTFLFGTPSTNLSEKPCFIDAEDPERRFFTRNAFRLWSQRLALGLTRLDDFENGDRILLFSNNQIFSPVAFMGVVMAGGIFSGANPTFTPRELAYQWKDTDAKYLLCVDSSIDIGIAAAAEAGMDKRRVLVFNSALFDGSEAPGTESVKGCEYWGNIFASAEDARLFQWEELDGKGKNDKTIALNYSSGTTGFPKGVEVTHRNYISNALQHNFIPTLHPEFEAKEPKRKWLCYLPLYHALGQTVFIAGSLMRQIPVYIMAKFDFIQMLVNVQKFRITEMMFVPPIAVAVAKHPAVAKYDLSSVDAISCGAAPLGMDISLQLEKVWGGRLNMKQGYGMTEVTCSVLGWDPNLHSDSFGVGEPNPNVECRIMNVDNEADMQEVTQRGPEHRGELWLRGPNIMKGYWGNPEATKNAFSTDGERWLRTGDIAYVDEKGTFFIVDRIKELIKVKGNQVAPAELEALLLEHPAVADVAVIGIPTEEGDEKPRAYIVRQQGNEGVNEREILKFVEEKVVKYKQLTGGIEWVKEIPKNPSGKILRKLLRDQHKEKTKKEGAHL